MKGGERRGGMRARLGRADPAKVGDAVVRGGAREGLELGDLDRRGGDEELPKAAGAEGGARGVAQGAWEGARPERSTEVKKVVGGAALSSRARGGERSRRGQPASLTWRSRRPHRAWGTPREAQ